MNGSLGKWAISPEERNKHDQMFDTLLPAMGYITGEQARKFFLQSGLPGSTLAEIWALADMNKDGKMDRLEFSIAMKLIKLKLQGTPLPSALPIIMKQPPVPAPTLNAAYGMGAMSNLSMLSGPGIGMLTPLAMGSPGLSPMGSLTSLTQMVPTATGMSPLMSTMGNAAVLNSNMGVFQPYPVGSVATGLPLSAGYSSSPLGFASPSVGVYRTSSLLDIGSSSSNSSSPALLSSKLPVPSDWSVPHASRLKYRQQFNSLDKQMTGYLTGLQVRNAMATTMLTQTQLASIWNLADLDKDGKLKAEEFILAMHLVDMAKSGQALPPTLPGDLVPPTHRAAMNGSSSSLYLTDDLAVEPPQKIKSNLTFEDKFKANLERGNAELEKRRQQLLEAQRREQERQAQKEREERERREQEAREAEERRRKEEERRLERHRELERQREEERQKEIERKEAAQRVLERQRQEEFERRRRGELQIKKVQEQDDIIRLKARKRSLEMELEAVGDKQRQISDRLRDAQGRRKLQRTEADLIGQRMDTRRDEINGLQRQLEEFQRKLSQMGPEQKRLTEKLQTMGHNNMPGAPLSTLKLNVTERNAACHQLRQQLETLERDTSVKLSEMDQYNHEVQDLRESTRKQQAELEKLMSVKEEKRREAKRKMEQEEARKRQEEERKRQEEERKRQEEERKRQEEERHRREEEEAQRRIKEEKDRQWQEKLRRDEEERKRKIQEEREAKLREEEEKEVQARLVAAKEQAEREQRAKEETERRRRQEEEQRKREEEERRRQEERKMAEEERRKLEEERRKLEEERRKLEEERRREDKRRQEDEERKRQEGERWAAEQKREKEEGERRRQRAAEAAVRDTEERKKQEKEEEEEKKRRRGEEEQRKKREEEDRRRREEERRRQEEEVKRKREEEEERKKGEEERRRRVEASLQQQQQQQQQQQPSLLQATGGGGKLDIQEKLTALLRGLEERKGGLQPRASQHRKSAALTSFRALYPFTARNQDELSFDADDVIEVDETTEREAGWFYGSKLGKMGWFPESYVERAADAPVSPVSPGVAGAKMALKPHLSKGPGGHGTLEAAMAVGSKSAFTPTHSPNPAPSETQGQVVGNLQAKALCSWTAKTDSHLNFSKDDVIRVLEQQDSWWLGELAGAQGWFPKTYVTLLGDGEASVDAVFSNPDGSDGSQMLEEYVALFTYESPQTGDLTFQEGDVLLVSQREGEWWNGAIGDRIGLFPSNYVKPKESDTSSLSGKKKNEIGQVVTGYASSGLGQLSLAPGQLVLILSRNVSGWWLGELQARGKKRQKGWFPATHVTVLGANSGKSTPAPLPVCQVIAIYDYTAANGDEMSFSKGQLINVTNKNDPDWWKGELNGVTGLFPTNYIQVTTTECDPSQQWCANLSSLETMSPQERKRQGYIHELMETEEKYVEDLQIVLEVFHKPMSESGRLTEAEMGMMFVNWKELIACNTKLLKALRVRKKTGGDNMPVQVIGDILAAELAHLQPYIRFCSCQINGASLLQTRTDNQPEFKDFLKKLATDYRCKGMPLSSFLLKPMQRITRYPLHIKNILESTAEGHADRGPLKEALERAEELCQQVNEGVREKENSDRLEWIQNHVQCDGVSENLVFNSLTNCLGPRKLLHSGKMHKAKSNKELWAFLFNDFLLLTHTSKQFTSSGPDKLFSNKNNIQLKMYKPPVFLNEVLVKLPDPSSDEPIFHISHIDRVYILKTDNINERTAWVQKVKAASENFIETEKKKREKAYQARSLKPSGIGRLLVTILEATELKPNKAHGKSNPYCEVTMGAQMYTSRTLNDTLNPKWNFNCQFHIRDLYQDVLCITIFERDQFCPDDFLGRTEVPVATIKKELENKGAATRRLLLHEVPTGEVWVRLDLQLFNPK